MKPWLFALGIPVMTIMLGTIAEAQNYPWCAQYSGGNDGGMNCGFVSFDQCMATVRGMVDFVSRIIHTSRRPDRSRRQGLQDALAIERIADHDLRSGSQLKRSHQRIGSLFLYGF